MKNIYKIKYSWFLLAFFISSTPVNAQFNPVIELNDVAAKGAGFKITMNTEQTYWNDSVSGVGDINADGVDDVIVAIEVIGDFGQSSMANYVVFGHSDGFDSEVDLLSLDGTNGFILNGLTEFDDLTNFFVSDAGDVNGDGIDDLIIGALGAEPNGFASGASYVVFGKATDFEPVIVLSLLNGNDGFVINGVGTRHLSGRGVSSAGDVNGDGFDDLIIGARFIDPNGAGFIIYGHSGQFPAAIELSSLNGVNGTVINGVDAWTHAGTSVNGSGDYNGDGFDDVIIGAGGVNGNGERSGVAYVIFGKAGSLGSVIELSELNGSDGFIINGADAFDIFGGSVSHAGDVNGDGYDDFIIGALGEDTNGSSAGAGYVLFGQPSNNAVIELSSLNGSNGFVINGVSGFDNTGFSVANAGDFNGDGVDDLVIGAPGARPNGNNSGVSYILFGNTRYFPASLELSSLDGSLGIAINGIGQSDQLGGSVSAAGDVNNDGFDDVIIGSSSRLIQAVSSGDSFVVYGFSNCQTDGFGYQIETAPQLNEAIECANHEPLQDTINLNQDIMQSSYYDNYIITDNESNAVEIGKTGFSLISSSIVFEGNGYALSRDPILPCLTDMSDDLNEFRLLVIAGVAADLSIKNMKLLNGCADGSTLSSQMGGALFAMNGEAEFHNVVWENNLSTHSGGAVYTYVDHTTRSIEQSTFSNNMAGFGGAIYAEGVLDSVINSTFSANSAIGYELNNPRGGAISNTGIINQIINNTFAFNTAQDTGGSAGGALHVQANINSIENNIFYKNFANTGADCDLEQGMTSGQNNLSNVVNLSCVGLIIDDLIPQENGLGPLSDNGCLFPFADGSCAQTHATKITTNSINAGNQNATNTDQRYFFSNGIRDIGAFEFEGINPDIIFKDGFD